MYLFEQLKKIHRDIEIDVPLHHYRLDNVEIDNPFHDCKVSVPCFVESAPVKPSFVDMKAIAFGLQTLFDAGVSLTPGTIVNGSYLREVEKFIDNVKNKNV